MSRARKREIVNQGGRADVMPEYVSEVGSAIHRLCDIGELIADGLFAIAAGVHTKTPGDQRNMAAVFRADALNRYGDVLKKLEPKQRKELDAFVENICKGKR